jgi:hypothetical protein
MNVQVAWAEKEATYQKEKAELEARINQLTQQMKEHEEKLANMRTLEEEKERLANELRELKSKPTTSEVKESLPPAPPERKGWMYKQTAKGRIIKRFFILRYSHNLPLIHSFRNSFIHSFIHSF